MWQAVPTEPTEAMLDAFSGTKFSSLSPGKQKAEREAYARMLKVAPKSDDRADPQIHHAPENHVSQCPRCGWESSFIPPTAYPTCPSCNWPDAVPDDYTPQY